MIRRGEKTIIRKLVREDVDKMVKWGKHRDILFTHYNFPPYSPKERDLWFKLKAERKGNKCFAIEDLEGNLIGYISLRNIRFFKRESELGIVLDPDCLGKGYGSDALYNFLDIYFNDLKMKKIVLRVAKYNERAFRCYIKCGFEVLGEILDEFEDQDMEEDRKYILLNDFKDFTLKDGKIMAKYYFMKLTKEKYLIHKKQREVLISL